MILKIAYLRDGSRIEIVEYTYSSAYSWRLVYRSLFRPALSSKR